MRIILLLVMCCVLADGEVLRNYIFDNGGGRIHSAHFSGNTSIGQNITGSMRSANFSANIGQINVGVGTSIEENSAQKPQKSLQISALYPMPFNSSLSISFEIPKPDQIHMIIFSIDGKMVFEKNQMCDVGCHEFKWDATDQPTGMYLIKINSTTSSVSKKIILVR